MFRCLLLKSMLLLCLGAFAQSRPKNTGISIGGEFAIPVRKAVKGSAVGIGASIAGEVPILNKTTVTLNSGYLYYPSDILFHQVIHHLWLVAGARYYYLKRAYISARLGPGLGAANDFSFFHLYYGGGIGVKPGDFDLSVFYMSIARKDFPFSTIGLRMAYAL